MTIADPLPLFIGIAVVVPLVFYIGVLTERSDWKYHLHEHEIDARIRANVVRRRLHDQVTSSFIAMTNEADRRRSQP